MMEVKKQKLLLNGNNMTISDDDRISNLPELVLHHILSFLPTKTAALTCILSKRWMYLWTSIPILDFDSWYGHLDAEEFFLHADKFMDFVDRTLLLRDMYNPNIQKFILDCNGLINYSRISAWISFVLRHKVEELVIRNARVPSSLFVSQSLTRLELKYIKDVYLPKCICFPMLKILKLQHVYFSNVIDQLIPNSPVLEELVIKGCNLEMICISSPSLKHLTCSDLDLSVKIWTPNLVFLSYSGWFLDLEILHSLSSLVEARIQGYTENEDVHGIIKERIGSINLLGELCNVKKLSFSLCTLREFCISDHSTNLPTLYNVTHLKVDSDIFCTNDKALLKLLQSSPVLESLVFEGEFPPYLSDGDDEESTLDTVLESLLLSLKSVEFLHFEGHKREICVVKFFLKIATVLQSMTIHKEIDSSYLSNHPLSRTLEEEILGLPRVSSTCVIKFEEICEEFNVMNFKR